MGKQIKSKKRVRDYGEVFTPEFIVADINDLCEPDISDIEKKSIRTRLRRRWLLERRAEA